MVSIADYGHAHGIPTTKIKQSLRRSFPGQTSRYSDEDVALREDELVALDHAGLKVLSDASDPAQAALEALAPDPILALPIARPSPPRRPPAVSRLQLHEDFVDWLASAPPPQRAAALRALEALIAHGRPNRMKSVRGTNAGWLRTPVGGTDGRQYYLWFAARGAAPVGDRLGPGEVLVRAVRHHDATSDPIAAGDDWMPWTPADLFEESDRELGHHPLSPAQRGAARHLAPIQLVRGTPGAGKTTALLHGVRGLEGRVLYLTFGPALVARAREWFDAFASDAVAIETRAISDLLGRLAGGPEATRPRDPDERTRVEVLTEALRLRLGSLGPWVQRGALDARALHDELHAQLFGRDGELPTERDYLARRRGAIGEEAAAAAWRAAQSLSLEVRERLFPGPVAARRALTSEADLVERAGLGVFDWIVVDEVQDLTGIELEAVLAFARSIARSRGKRPGLRLAGDEGQTLRPTGFSWSALKELVVARLGSPEESVLTANLRSSREVAGFVQRLTDETYRKRLPKERRPRGQGAVEIDPVDGGEVLLLTGGDLGLGEITRALKGIGAIVEVGRPADTAVADAARSAGARHFTSETAKGLDFDTVAVFGLGAVLAELEALSAQGTIDGLALERARNLADHARVAASRAVSRLVLVEHGEAARPDRLRALYEGRAEDYDALEGPTDIALEALAERLDQDTGDAIARLVDELRLCEELLDREPSDAFERAEAAYAALVRAGRAQAVGTALRDRVFLYRGRARVGRVAKLPREAWEAELGSARDHFNQAGATATKERVAWLRGALRANVAPTSRLRELAQRWRLITAVDGVDPWTQQALLPLFHAASAALLEAVAQDGVPDTIAQARELRDALDHLGTAASLAHHEAMARVWSGVLGVLARSRPDAKDVLARLELQALSDAARLRAEALDTLGDEAAIDAWLEAGQPHRAIAFLRSAGKPAEALALGRIHGVEPDVALETVTDLLGLFARIDELEGQLTAGEREILRARLPRWMLRSAERRTKKSP